jgi:hypothetical protein
MYFTAKYPGVRVARLVYVSKDWSVRVVVYNDRDSGASHVTERTLGLAPFDLTQTPAVKRHPSKLQKPLRRRSTSVSQGSCRSSKACIDTNGVSPVFAGSMIFGVQDRSFHSPSMLRPAWQSPNMELRKVRYVIYYSRHHGSGFPGLVWLES